MTPGRIKQKQPFWCFYCFHPSLNALCRKCLFPQTIPHGMRSHQQSMRNCFSQKVVHFLHASFSNKARKTASCIRGVIPPCGGEHKGVWDIVAGDGNEWKSVYSSMWW